MKTIKTYEDFVNEEINLRKAATGLALGASLAFNTPVIGQTGTIGKTGTSKVSKVSKTPSKLTCKLSDGSYNYQNIIFSIDSPEKFDSLFGNKSTLILKDLVEFSNEMLKGLFSMKMDRSETEIARLSYKPIQSKRNSIRYERKEDIEIFRDEDRKYVEDRISIDFIVEFKNGYGNKIAKEYTYYITGKKVNLSDIKSPDVSMFRFRLDD